MALGEKLDEARASAQVILELQESEVANLFFHQAMRRNLSRTVRQLDRLVRNGGDDRSLGTRALQRLGFAPDA